MWVLLHGQGSSPTVKGGQLRHYKSKWQLCLLEAHSKVLTEGMSEIRGKSRRGRNGAAVEMAPGWPIRARWSVILFSLLLLG